MDNAQPGVFMQAAPQVGRWFRQEWYPGQAQGTYTADTMTAATVPAGTPAPYAPPNGPPWNPRC